MSQLTSIRGHEIFFQLLYDHERSKATRINFKKPVLNKTSQKRSRMIKKKTERLRSIKDVHKIKLLTSVVLLLRSQSIMEIIYNDRCDRRC